MGKGKFGYLLVFTLTFLVIDVAATVDRLRTSWRKSPSTTMTIGWDQADGSGAKVYFGTKDLGNSKPDDYPMSQGIDLQNNHKGMSNKFSRLENLKPGTMYYFVIKDNNSTSKRYKFRTAPATATGEKLSFIHGGDSRSSRSGRQSVNRHVAKIRPLFIAFGGDFINTSDDRSWADWLTDWQLVIDDDGLIPAIVPARGNHESDSDVRNLFDTPTSDVVYAFSFGRNLFRMWVLNSERGNDSEQGRWLDSELKDHSNTLWKMVQWHSPISPIGPKSFERGLWTNWANVLYTGGVNLAAESHSHVVKRTWPIKPSSGASGSYVRDDKTGTVYIGEGSWGVPVRSVSNNYSWVMGSGAFPEFNWVQITPNSMNVRTIMTSGNASSIPYVDLSDPFKVPNGMNLWKPGNQDAVTNLVPYVVPIFGCTDPNATNYNEKAHINDNSCVTTAVKNPNTVYDKFTVSAEIRNDAGIYFPISIIRGKGTAFVKIWDKKGRLIWAKNFSDDRAGYNLSLPKSAQPAKGVYFIQLAQGDNKIARAFTVFK